MHWRADNIGKANIRDFNSDGFEHVLNAILPFAPFSDTIYAACFLTLDCIEIWTGCQYVRGNTEYILVKIFNFTKEPSLSAPLY